MTEGLHMSPSVGDGGFLTVSFRDLSWAVRPQNLIHIVSMKNRVWTKRILFIFRRPLSNVTDIVVIVLALKTYQQGSCSHLLPLGSEGCLLIQKHLGCVFKMQIQIQQEIVKCPRV